MMASSSREEPCTSPIVADATSMVSMEAEMVVATGRDRCHELKDMLNRADPSTMVVVMASGNQTSTLKPRSPVMDPRLLAAACSGSFQDLETLLNGDDHQASSERTIGSSMMHRASGDEEAFLRESLLDAVTIGGNTLLHVIATNGDREDFLNKATFIHMKAKNLLFVQNNRGDTPLHCAARAGNSQMVSLLIDLTKGQDNNVSRVKALLETENKLKETALHEAVRSGNNDMVKLFLEEDPQLASFPKDGTSPLYLAILLLKKITAETLYESSRGVISYSGPNGQNALHAAVLRDKDLTEMLLEWNKALTIQQDENGSTPLHLVASVLGQSDRRTIRALLLEANPDALYQPDNNGLFPIHVAASVDATLVIRDFLKKSSRCAGLRNARGRTFLHIAVDKMHIHTVGSACRNRSLSWILNMQDNDGNTALHLAIQRGGLTMFCALFGNRQVSLNLTNEKGETALDIARCNLPKHGLYYNQNSEAKIHLALKFAGAKCGISRQDNFEENDIIQETQDDNKNMEIVKEGTQTLCIGSVLIATVTFGATFAMPGGYRADDHNNGGTPTLAGRYAFDAFTLANALAFTFATMATISLMSSGSPLYNIRSRKMHLGMAFYFMKISLASLVAAFAIGTYMMISPVAHKAATGVCVLSSLLLLYTNLELTIKNVVLIAPLCMRKGILWTLLTSVVVIIGNITVQLWPIIVIFCSTARNYPAGKVEPAVQPPTPFV
uniref:PGG domain-containing protein n=2 Tax=Aegilops tauschii subsp. strangulata TaxID=200361 RepID=A0A453Q6J7_AEGTS